MGGADGRRRGTPAAVLLIATLITASVVTPFEILGDINDVVDGVVKDGDGAAARVVVVSSVSGGKRLLTYVDAAKHATRAGPVVPEGAAAWAVCGNGVVFVDSRGLVDDTGRRLIDRTPLLAVADPSSLFAADLCPGETDERMLVVNDGLVVIKLKDGAVIDERVLDFPARARGYSGRGVRSLRGERPYAQALSLYAPRLFAVDVDGDGDRDLVALQESRLAVFRRTAAGLATTPEVRDLAALVGAGVDDDLRVRFAGARAAVSVSRGAVPEQSRVVVIDGTVEQPFSRVKSTQTHNGLALLLGITPQGVVVGTIDTSLVSLSGVVLTGRVAVKVSVDNSELLTLAAAADVRAGKMDGALPIVDVDVDGDGIFDLFDLGEPGTAVLYRGSRPRSGDDFDVEPRASAALTEKQRWTIPRFAQVVPLPSSSSVALTTAPTKGRAGKSRLVILSR